MALDDHAHAAALPCGASLDDLIAQVTEDAAPLDRAHQAACRHCQQALDAIREAWEEFQAVARTAIAVPEDLAERIVARIRTLARSGGDGVVLAVDRGETRIAHGVLGRLARTAARSVPGVLLASTRSAGPDPATPGSVVVVMRLVVAYGPSATHIAEAVRERVIAELARQAGADVSRVEVAVEDVVVDGGDVS